MRKLIVFIALLVMAQPAFADFDAVSNFPTALDTKDTNYFDKSSGDTVQHYDQDVHSDAIVKIETKLGYSSSTPTLNMILYGSGAGTSAWGLLQPLMLDDDTDTPADGECLTFYDDGGDGEFRWDTCGVGGSGDQITVDDSDVTDPDFDDGGDINFTATANVITADIDCSGCIDSTMMGTDSVDADQIAANAVGQSEISTDGVGAAEIATNAVGSSEIAANAVENSEMANDAIGNDEMADNAVGSAEIIDGSVDVSDDTNLAVSGYLAVLTGDTISVKENTMTDTKICRYLTASGLNCDQELGVATAGGSNTQIQYNDSTALGGMSTLIRDASSGNPQIPDDSEVMLGAHWEMGYDAGSDVRLEFRSSTGGAGRDVHFDLQDDNTDSSFTITNSNGVQEANLVVEGDVNAGTITDGTASMTAGSLSAVDNITVGGDVDFGAADMLEIPSDTDLSVDGGTPAVDAVGEIGIETDAYELWLHPGNSVQKLNFTGCSSGEILKHDGTKFACSADAGAGAVAFSDISDAGGDSDIDFSTGYTVLMSNSNNGTDDAWMTMSNEVNDVTVETTILKLAHDDDGDADAIFFECVDDFDGTPNIVFQVGADGATNVDGTVTASGFTGPLTGAVTGNVTGDVTGNATTATDLAANGLNCADGQIPLGVDAGGAVEGCYEPVEADITDLNHHATSITDGIILEADLNADEPPVDNDILTFDTTDDNFSWQTPDQLNLVTDTTTCTDLEGTGLSISAGTLNWTATSNGVTLETHTAGNYVQSITNGTGISGGDGGSEAASLTLSTTLGTAIDTTEITNDTILEADLDITNAIQDNYCLTADVATGGFSWATCGSGGSGTLNEIFEEGSAADGSDADIATLDFDGDYFALTENPDTEINITMEQSPTYTGTIEAGTLTDGTASMTGGALSGVTSVSVDSSTDPVITFDVTDAEDTDWSIQTNADAGESSDDNLEFRLDADADTDAAILWLEPDTGDMVFGGATTTGQTNVTRIDVTDPTGTRTIVLPDASGTLALSASVPAVVNATTGNITINAASDTATGSVELATIAETNTGTDATRAVTPDGLEDWTGSAQVTTLGTIATGVWNAGNVTSSGTITDGAFSTTAGAVSGVTSLSVDASSSPQIVLDDSDGGDASIFANTAVADGIMQLAVDDSEGVDTVYVELDGVNDRLEIKQPVVFDSTMMAGAVTMDFSDTTEDYVLTYNAGTDTWSGESAGAGTDDQTLAEVLAEGADANDVNITSLGEIALDLVDADGANIAIGDDDETIEIHSSAWDISTAGAVSGVTTLGMSGALSGATSGTFSTTVQAEQLTSTDDASITGTLTVGDVITAAINPAADLTITPTGVEVVIMGGLSIGDATQIGDNDLHVAADATVDGNLTVGGDLTASGSAAPQIVLTDNEATDYLTDPEHYICQFDLSDTSSGGEDMDVDEQIKIAGNPITVRDIDASAGTYTVGDDTLMDSFIVNGTIQGDVNIISDADGIVVTADQMGSAILMTGAGEVQIPDVCDSATGENLCVYVRDASETVEIAVTDTSDTINYKGLSLGPNDELDSPGAAMDFVCLVCMETNEWYVWGVSGSWTDGGVAD